jgi:DNA phosphorothioation-associated putative methyltransferase
MYFKGKIVGDARYVHKGAIELLEPSELKKITAAASLVENTYSWNVVKLELRQENKLSFLDYEDFQKTEFPSLLHSCQVDLKSETIKKRNYSPNNPPILHRKELLIDPRSGEIDKYRGLTKELEDLGAFSNPMKIGTKQNWTDELDALGIRVENHKVVPINKPSSSANHKREIARYRTAISRSSLSLPAKILFTGGIANETDSYLDYGCGRGDDIKFLRELGVNATGWDPHFAPDGKFLVESDVVNLGFVLNVIEDPNERIEVLRKAFQLAKKCLCVAVMLHSQNNTSNALPFRDGHITSINTFQKFFEQKELEVLLTKALQKPLVAGAPGVFLIFKDESCEQEFLLKRQLGIIQSYEPRDLMTKINERKEAQKRALNVVNNLARHILIFARKPAIEELPRYFRDQLEKSDLTYQQAFNGAAKLISDEQLAASIERKKEQLELFFAMYFFSGRTRYGDLSPSLQKDVKLHFGSVRAVEENAKSLLFSLGNEELVFSDARDSDTRRLGVLEDTKFVFLTSRFNELPVRLRGIVSVAERLTGKPDDANLIRIHIDTKKVSYLCVDGFETEALPKIVNRTIVDLRQQTVRRIEHLTPGYEKVLYQKSRFMDGSEKYFKEQKAFDDLIMGELDFDFFGEGPRYQEFMLALAERKITPPNYY